MTPAAHSPVMRQIAGVLRLELKTTFSWNMYSNLVTVAGRSNHLLVPRTWPLSDAQRHLVTLLGSNDPYLQLYVVQHYRIPLRQLQAYTTLRGDGRLRYEVDGVVRDVPRIGSDPVLSQRVPSWRAKLQSFSAVGETDRPRCMEGFGYAR